MKQVTDTILMVRPRNFGFNPETAGNNRFQTNSNTLTVNQIREKAVREFDTLVKRMTEVGIDVLVVEDSDLPVKSDAVFPNNWFTTHENGDLITYPMFSPIRRLERQESILEQIRQDFQVKKWIHLEDNELEERYLEGTGSMVLDRENSLVYACRSIRTDEGILDEFCRWMAYEAIVFDAYDQAGIPIYHTNVMMALGVTFVVICLEAVRNEEQRLFLTRCFEQTGKELITISLDQMNAFAGNMLQVKSRKEEATFLVMSDRAYFSLLPEQIDRISRHSHILSSDLSTIETYGGGSARCMMAEIFLEKRG